MDHHDQTKQPLSQSSASVSATQPSVEIDFEAYLPYLEDADICEDEKLKLIETLFSIMRSFCDLGFGIHPVQHPCGKLEQAIENPTRDSGYALDSMSSSLVSKFDISSRELEHSETGGNDV